VQKRTTSSELEQLVKRRKLGISVKLSGSIGRKASNSWAIDDVERAAQHAFQGEKGVQINYSGTPSIRITFHRHRLADHHRSISEKALIDALQYCGAIGGDSEREIRLFVEDQVKVGSKAEERTEVVIEYPEVDFDNLWIPRKRTDGR
jgi:hypothetical protein